MNLEEVNPQIHETESSKSPDGLEPEKVKLDEHTCPSTTGGNVQQGDPSGLPDIVPETGIKEHRPFDRANGSSPEENRGPVLSSTENTLKEKLDESGQVSGDNDKPGIQSVGEGLPDSGIQEVREGSVNDRNHSNAPDDVIVPKGEVAKIKANIAAIKHMLEVLKGRSKWYFIY